MKYLSLHSADIAQMASDIALWRANTGKKLFF